MTLTLNLALFGRTIACRISTSNPPDPAADSYSVGADTERSDWSDWEDPDINEFGFQSRRRRRATR